jgi:hypothetical protein
MEYTLSTLVALLFVIVLLRRPIKRAIYKAVKPPARESDDELAMIIARERAPAREDAKAESAPMGECKIARAVRGVGKSAYVRVRCRSIGEGTTTIRVASTASGSWEPCEEWNTAATRGVALGLQLAETTAQCEITLVRGTDVDTVDATMAIAGIRAVWHALAFRPTGELDARMERALERSGRMTLADLEVELS